jgi:hypothetical protein
MALVREKVYLREAPVVKVTLVADKNSPAMVIKDQFRALQRGAVSVDLIASPGDRVPSSLPNFDRTERPDDFERLQPGQTKVYHLEVVSSPPMPGDYIVRVEFAPTTDPSWKIRQDLRVQYVDIPVTSIKENIPLVDRIGHGAHAQNRTVELLKVMSEEGCQLIYRSFTPEGKVDLVQRLCPLDISSRLAAVSKAFWHKPEQRDRVWLSQVWVAFNREGELHLVKLDAVAGNILEDTILGGSQ